MDRFGLHDLVIKEVNYGSEEYIKALLTKARTDRKLENINPYVGVLQYPSSAFLQSDLSYGKSVQNAGMYYVGHMEFLLPKFESPVTMGCAYTVLSFELDGVVRQFLQISNGEQISQGKKFKDFVLSLYPTAQKKQAIPFNRAAYHVLTEVEVFGAKYNPSETGEAYILEASGLGAYTPAIQFEIAISGFRALMI